MSSKVRRHSRWSSTSAEGNIGDLPSDLIFQIFLRLSSKTLAICRCLSKQWASLLRSLDFTELFMTQSVTRPRLLFILRRTYAEAWLYSCPQPQISDKNPESESSLSVTAEFHLPLFSHWVCRMSPSISGLLYAPGTETLCNPSTRHVITSLPYPQNTLISNFFGYDPIDKEWKVLAISKSESSSPSDADSDSDSDSSLLYSYEILNLGSGIGNGNGKLYWKSLQCPLPHCPSKTSVCINGTLYFHLPTHNKIACFDLNSEEFKYIDEPSWLQEPDFLVNFKAKLGGIASKWKSLEVPKFEFEMILWVLEDVEKQEWSKHEYVLTSKELWNRRRLYFIAGVTGNGDIVMALRYVRIPLYVYFFNPEKNILRKVEIKGFGELLDFESNFYYFDACVDYVEQLRVPTCI